MAKSLTQIKTELGITDSTTLSDLLTLAETNEVFSQQEINKIKALSVMPLPNKVTNQADMLKQRFTNIVLNDDNSSTHSANIRNVILTEIVKKLNTTLTGVLNGTNLDSFGDVETALTNYYLKTETFNRTEINSLVADSYITLSGSSGTLTTEQSNILFSGKYASPVIILNTNSIYIMVTNSTANATFRRMAYSSTTNDFTVSLSEINIIKSSGAWAVSSNSYNAYKKNYIDTNRVSSWSETPNDTHFPTEKLVKDTISGNYITLSESYTSGTLTDSEFNILFGGTTANPIIIRGNIVFTMMQNSEAYHNAVFKVHYVRNEHNGTCLRMVENEIYINKNTKAWSYSSIEKICYDKTYIDNHIIDNLTTASATSMLSANMGKKLQDEKVAYTDVKNTLSDTSTNKPLSAYQGTLLKGMIDDINTLIGTADSSDSDTTINRIKDIYNFLAGESDNATLLDLLSAKIPYTDIVDNLTSELSNKVLSAKQGYVLKGYIDTLNDAETGMEANEAERTETFAEWTETFSGWETEFGTWEDEIDGKQDKIDSSHKLDSDLVDDTNQTNKFVSASEKAQITTNQNNITSLQNNFNALGLSVVNGCLCMTWEE